MQRMKRNGTYYADATKQNCWCELCYSKLKENEVITLDDDTETWKSNLQVAKHDSLPEETWIECDDCKSRVHKICALYNGRSSNSKSTFWCPKCILKNRDPDEEPTEFNNRAQDLPKCKMSDSMEEGLEKTLATAYDAKAKELGVGVDEVEKAKGLSIRVLSHIEKKHSVRDMVSFFA
jgi:E1A/CREB-binding protein